MGEQNAAHNPADYYSQLDRGFWANGWIAVLSARAVAALVILLDATWMQAGTDTVDEEVRPDLTVKQVKALRWWHLTETQLTRDYQISRDMFDRGVNELIEWQVVESRKRASVPRTTWAERRWYRELRVRLEVLRTPVADVAGGRRVPRVAHSSEPEPGDEKLGSTARRGIAPPPAGRASRANAKTKTKTKKKKAKPKARKSEAPRG
ncbi:hypothetical protein PO878_00715 [Iamia majanohamensis]|uniref:Uncharacterized protein n=1 Tax=Iamia majanohamensis TaxID=467976 RepID=A0AAE9Y9R4_9ACTN|nr:hypothetical protein [Iamia majanohamensis]WCO67243.1 hypothetical protein PO878_00715 [Iamia majanohamensis]